MLSDPRCALKASALAEADALRSGGGGLTGRLTTARDLSETLRSTLGREGHTNLSMHLRLGGEAELAGSSCWTGCGAG